VLCRHRILESGKPLAPGERWHDEAPGWICLLRDEISERRLRPVVWFRVPTISAPVVRFVRRELDLGPAAGRLRTCHERRHSSNPKSATKSPNFRMRCLREIAELPRLTKFLIESADRYWAQSAKSSFQRSPARNSQLDIGRDISNAIDAKGVSKWQKPPAIP
jgi:hypothetical protein